MAGFLESVIGNDYMPHGYCFLWQPELLWLHALSDLIIAIAYFSIPISIGVVLYKRKKAIPFYWLFGLFAGFIFLCGLTHIVEMISIWKAFYYIEGLLKLLTAALSIATALLVFPLIPVLLDKFEDLANMEARDKDENEAS
ncbi:MAG: hypothetical protein CMH28_04670 [Micavibrio sp.]|nr:hypothetical protein [Micavibrio sp.]